MLMKNILFAITVLLLSGFTASAQKTIQIKNTSDDNRLEVVSIPFAKFSKHFGVDTVFTIKDRTSGTTYTHQLERLGLPQVQNVLVQVQIAPKSSLELLVSNEQPSAYPNKTYARYVPERFDDFAWENDVIAFRIYGKALEGRPDDAQGIDVWSKRTTDLVINKWYKENDYHKDHGQGLDYYSVGQTLGAGDIALFFNDQIQYTKHYRQYQVLDNGPLRTTFKLTFEPQEFNGNTVSLTKTISIDAGQQFNKISVSLQNRQAKTTPVVVGLVKRDEDNPQFDFDPKDKTLSYWEPNINNAGHVGTSVILPSSKIQFIPNTPKQFLIKTVVTNKKPLVYYMGAAWNKAGKITSADQWEDYVEDYAQTIKKPLKVTLK